jgi:hypothetical protein
MDRNIHDNIEIDDWITPIGTDSVQQVTDMEVVNGETIYYTDAGLAYTFDQLEIEPLEEDFNIVDPNVMNDLMDGICLN